MPSGSFTAGADILASLLTHDRTQAHSGTQLDTTVVLSTAIGRYAAGTTVHDVLVDMVSRLASATSVPSFIGSFTADWLVAYAVQANAVILGAGAGSFSADAYVFRGVVGSFTANATKKLVGTGSITAQANFIYSPVDCC